MLRLCAGSVRLQNVPSGACRYRRWEPKNSRLSKRQVVLRLAGSQAHFPDLRSGRLCYRWRPSRFSRHISCRFRLCYPLDNPRISSH
nr:MAG TPA: hypothetical protein [Inoviridae sp.]